MTNVTTQQPVAPDVLFVLDKSSSMTMTWQDGGATVARWESLRSVVSTVATDLSSQVAFGAKVYPKLASGFGDCEVEAGFDVAPALDNASTLLGTLPADDAALQGSTPTQAGVEAAIAALNADYANDPSGTPPQAMILVADGGIGCDGSSTDTAAAIAAAFAQSPNSISTYVVGIDISAFVDDEMNAYATAGGHPLPGTNAFYEVSDGDQLAAAIAEIGTEIATCDIVLDPALPENGEVEIEVDGTAYAEVGNCDTESGWVWLDPVARDELRFCGAACDALKSYGSADITYYCVAG